MTTPASQINKLSLYHYDSYPYFKNDRSMINDLEQDTELENRQLQSEKHTELVQGSGKSQVPYLHMDTENIENQWLYELDKLFVM